jgi:hypothetical protein
MPCFLLRVKSHPQKTKEKDQATDVIPDGSAKTCHDEGWIFTAPVADEYIH